MNAHSPSIRPERAAKSPGPACAITVARTLDEIMQVVALRAIVYMGEQACPHDEEFDGNDFAGATHLVARVMGQPAGCLRIRWFASFFKIERVVVRAEHRRGGVAVALMRAAIEMGRRKGYTRLCGHVTPDLVPFWVRQLGVTPRRGRPLFRFSDVDYAEVEQDLPPHPDSLDMDSDPLVLLRPEGEWDRPGVLDRSAARPPLHESRMSA